MLSVDARRCGPDTYTESGYEVTTHGGKKGTGIDAVAWARKGQEPRGGGDPAELHGCRRHHRWIRP
ncbi:hypothetical protein GCM10025876_36310 [Demequina litorisediminis]|uniref:Uncharacterized protein n=1 Tax=Demequina litorisediminis TaxID=1849022 RepID=A0ABQ6IJU4_9MICO|nr:hypothetical protein GCM10025876_36310 [Demequina litorisediminis]